MLAEQVVKVLVAERHRQGLRQQDVADRMGVKQNYVQKIESGGGRRTDTLDRYAEALNMTFEVALKNGEKKVQAEVQDRG